MSGLAEILLEEHFTISGSDSQKSPLTEKLTNAGAKIFYGQRASNIEEGTDLVVYTAAIHEDNPELAAAKAAGIPTLTRAELLGQIMDNYSDSVAIAGTHGKTTTTSMVSQIFRCQNGPDHFRWRYLRCDRWQHPRWKIQPVCDGGM